MERLDAVPEGLSDWAPQLRIMVLTSNKLVDLSGLRQSPHLEELWLCQNHLKSLHGLRHLPQLSVLRATMNEISEAEDLGHLPNLRQLDLSKNRLSSMSFPPASGLAKLRLYRNALTSTEFLQHLPCLTDLDLGRNRLEALDARISEWNPLLVKVHLEENSIKALPELRLPLLTDLCVDHNKLEELGPLGFLPSLDWLQVNSNKVRSLRLPLAASPLLQRLELSFNQLEGDAISRALLELALRCYPRLRQVQLNDNPLVADMGDAYRPWVLLNARRLEVLDNDPLRTQERRASNDMPDEHDPCLLFQMHFGGSCSSSSAGPCAAGHPSSAATWAGGCPGCAMVLWCEVLAAERQARFVAHTKEERKASRRTSEPVTGARAQLLQRDETLFMLRRRAEFWAEYVEFCGWQHDSLSPWNGAPPEVGGMAFRTLPADPSGVEAGKQRLVTRVQARWRGVRGRRICWGMRLDLRCEKLSFWEVSCLTRVQATWRSWLARKRLRRAGSRLPMDKRAEARTRAATALQALVRGRRVRAKLRAARDAARIEDDWMLECPEVDIDKLLQGAEDCDDFSPWNDLVLPTRVVVPAPAPPRPLEPRAAAAAEAAAAAGAPVDSRNGSLPPRVAWGTPPGSAQQPSDAALAGGRCAARPSSSSSSTGALSARRPASMSSTVMSGVTEAEGRQSVKNALREQSRLEKAQAEWGFEDPKTAQAFLNAQRNRQKRPPKLPGNAGGGGVVALPSCLPPVRGGVTRAPQRGGGRGGSCGPRAGSSAGGSKKPALKAQDAIAEWRRQQAATDALAQCEEQGAFGGGGGSPLRPGNQSIGYLPASFASAQSPLEFHSGEPNKKLERSSRSFYQPGGGRSPSPTSGSPALRSRSPLR